MKKIEYTVYETDVDHAYAVAMPANDDLFAEVARQGARRVAEEVARWFRQTMKLTVTDDLPASLQQVLEAEAPD